VLLAVPVAADARVIVTWDRIASPTFAANHEAELQAQLRAVTGILKAKGADYVVVPPTLMKTLYARTSTVPMPNGDLITASATIHLMFNGLATTQYANYRPDSLTLAAGAPTTPQLLLLSASGRDESTTLFGDAAADTLGVKSGSAGFPLGGTAPACHEGECTQYMLGRPGAWLLNLYQYSAIRNTTSPAGGLRVLLGIGQNAVYRHEHENGWRAPAWPDSFARNATGDTMSVWVLPMAHVAGAEPIVCAITTAAALLDSSEALYLQEHGVDWVALGVAMQTLDSLSGGAVFGDGPPVKVGFVALGGGTQSDRRHPGGLFHPDSATFKASVDSLDVPLTVAADPESLTAQEVAWWKRHNQVRFTPWVRTGLDTTAAGLGNASVALPVDVWGRWRLRAVLGDGSCTGADTSFACLYRAVRAQLQAKVGAGYLSALAVAPDDDWTPKNVSRSSNAKVDSILRRIKALGYKALLIDGQRLDNTLLEHPIGYGNQQRGGSGIHPALLAHSGYSIVGSSKFYGFTTDSAGNICSPGPCPRQNVAVYETSRWWHGLFPDGACDPEFMNPNIFTGNDIGVWINISDRLYGPRPARVLVVSMQGLGGDPTAPTRPAWWAIKSFVNAARAINASGRKPLIDIGWAEDATP
jgi:hypothetical protein